MGNIISDIVEDLDVKIKTSKTNFYLKWGGRITVSLIVLAFAFGQIKMKHLDRLDNIEKSQKENMKAIATLKQQVNEGFINVNNRIDKVYDDGYKEFIEFQRFNIKQFELIIDYSGKNKDLLKKMLEMNALENQKIVENKIKYAKKYNFGINVNERIQINVEPDLNYNNLRTMINKNDSNTIFYVIDPFKKYNNLISSNKQYNILILTENIKYPLGRLTVHENLRKTDKK